MTKPGPSFENRGKGHDRFIIEHRDAGLKTNVIEFKTAKDYICVKSMYSRKSRQSKMRFINHLCYLCFSPKHFWVNFQHRRDGHMDGQTDSLVLRFKRCVDGI